MFAKIILIACAVGIASAGALYNSALSNGALGYGSNLGYASTSNGYGSHGISSYDYGALYSPTVSYAGPSSAVSHVSRVDYQQNLHGVGYNNYAPVTSLGVGQHGYAGSYNYAPVSAAPAVSYAGPSHGVSHTSRLDVYASPVKSYSSPVSYSHGALGSYAPTAAYGGSYGYGNSGYGNNNLWW